eukprot:1159000-Pelagomonas_calceolata.AAC.6
MTRRNLHVHTGPKRNEKAEARRPVFEYPAWDNSAQDNNHGTMWNMRQCTWHETVHRTIRMGQCGA